MMISHSPAPTDPRPIPAALADTARRWQQQGRPDQPASRWSRTSWTRQFEAHHDFLASLPDRISRDQATGHARGAADSPQAALHTFLVAMIWGYGPVGYGPFRTARVLEGNPDAADRLAQAAAIAQRDGGLAAFEDLAARPLRYLGVAFGTKYLYFCAAACPATPSPAPILDAVVCRWLSTNTDLHLSVDTWRVSDYRRYLHLLADWGAQLDLPSTTVEELIFRNGVSREGSAFWGEAFTGTDAAPEPAELAADARRALAELHGTLTAADPELTTQAKPHLQALDKLIEDIWPTTTP